MTANPRLEGPLPPEGGLGWCAICAALYKGFALTSEPLATRLQEAIRSEKDEKLGLDPPAGAPLLQEAVAIGLADLPMANGSAIVPAPLCWSHLRGMKLSGIQAFTGAIPELGRGG